MSHRSKRSISLALTPSSRARRLPLAVIVLMSLLVSLAPAAASAATPTDESTPSQQPKVATTSDSRPEPATSSPKGILPPIGPGVVLTGNPAEVIGAPPATVPAGWEPGQEQVDKRTATTKTLTGRTPGEIETRVYPEPVHFKQNGKWASIDSNLQASSGGKRKAKANSFSVELADSSDNPELAKLSVDAEHSVAFGMDKAARVAAKVNNNKLTYSRTHKDTDVRLTSTRSGVKEELILASPNAPDRFVFPLRLKGLTASIDADGNVLYKDASGKEQARTPHGYMFDSKVDPLSGEPARSTGVTFALIPHGKGTALEVTLQKMWLNSPDREFPITVDPEIHRGAWSDDTYVMSGFNTNYSTDTVLKVGSWNGGGNKARAFMHFDTANLPAAITYAQLQMRETHSYHCGTDPQKIHRVTSGWAGSTLTSYPGAAIDGWATPGGWQAGSGSCGNRLATWNVTGDVQGWRNSGTTNGSFAAVAASETENYQWKQYRSYQGGDGPLLKIFSGNGPRTPSELQPPTMLPTKGPNFTVSARYDHPSGSQGQMAFGLWNGSGTMVWNQWSPWTCSGCVTPMSVSGLAGNAWYELRVAAFDGTTYSEFTPTGHWIFNNIWLPEVPTQIVPAPNAIVGQSFTASARYEDHWGFSGELEFRVLNQANQLIGSFRSPQPVAFQQIGTVQINLSPGTYTLFAYSHSYGLFSLPSNGIPITVATPPGMPTNVTASGMAEMAQVNWSVPNNGGAAVTAIKVTAQNQSGGPSKTEECPAACLSSNTLKIERLVGGDSYKFIVEALNVMGTGQASTPSAATPVHSNSILTPTAVSAAAVDGGADVTWTPPVLGGLLPLVTGYTVNTYRASDGAAIGSPKVSAVPSAEIRNLPNGTSVYFKVIATTAFIVVSPESLPSNTINPLGVPFPPAKPNASIVGEQATVSWSPPQARGEIPGDNGRPITGYTVNMHRESDQEIVRSEDVGASTTQLTVGQIQTATPYYFTVQASNEVGTSQNSPRSDSGSFSGKPFEPVNVSATGGFRSANVEWDAPPPLGDGTPGDNGSTITDYEVEVSPSCSQCTGLVTEVLSTNIEGLAPATQYSFKVYSVNAQGRSNASLTVLANTEIEPPEAPTGVRATFGEEEGTANVEWTPPTILNGSTLTGYVIKAVPPCSECEGLTVGPGATTGQVSNLTNGQKYRFRVSATSDAGPSDFSLESNEVTPHQYTYAALGDSYSSGVGAPQSEGEPYDPASGECMRSSKSYAQLFKSLSSHEPDLGGTSNSLFLTCAFARTSDVFQSQIQSVPDFADLVTISVGGNNVGFKDVLFQCSIMNGPDGCEPYFSAGGAGGDKKQLIEDLEPLLQLVYQEILNKANNAQLVVFTYPQIFSNDNRDNGANGICYGDAGIQPNEIEWIRERTGQLNEVIISAANAASATARMRNPESKPIEVIALGGALISERTSTSPAQIAPGLFDGHSVCQETEWINGITVDFSDDAIIAAIANATVEELISDNTYHPNEVGYQKMANKLLDLIG